MKRKQIKIGLFGFGCVGKGLYDVLEKSPGFKAEIKKICVKTRNKTRELPAQYFTYEKNDLLLDNDINVIVELIDDADAAWDIVSTALKNKKAVVSANKKMIAEHFEELLELQQTYKVPFLYEASCCASIPILRNLEEYYDNDMLASLTGIVNGSTNYILTSCTEKGNNYADALLEAQRLGYAETDPSLDLEGFDAKYKLSILLAHAFGNIVKPEHIFNEGISRIALPEIQFAREKGYKIKLLARAYKNDDETVYAHVLPAFLRPSHNLYNVDDVFNGIITETAFSDKQVFIGKGAGAFPTASAVLSDLSALTYNYKYEFKKRTQVKTIYSDQFIIPVYFRWDGSHLDFVSSFFEKTDEIYQSANTHYICGIITAEKLRALKDHINSEFCVIALN